MTTAYRSHPDEIAALIAGDGAEFEGPRPSMVDSPDSPVPTRAGESRHHMVTVLPNGAWLVSLACWRCGFLGGFRANQASAQQAIHDWQNGHVIECRGEVL